MFKQFSFPRCWYRLIHLKIKTLLSSLRIHWNFLTATLLRETSTQPAKQRSMGKLISSKNNFREITMGIGPIWGIHSLSFYPLLSKVMDFWRVGITYSLTLWHPVLSTKITEKFFLLLVHFYLSLKSVSNCSSQHFIKVWYGRNILK